MGSTEKDKVRAALFPPGVITYSSRGAARGADPPSERGADARRRRDRRRALSRHGVRPGETLARLLRRLAPRGERIPLPIVAAVSRTRCTGARGPRGAERTRDAARDRPPGRVAAQHHHRHRRDHAPPRLRRREGGRPPADDAQGSDQGQARLHRAEQLRGAPATRQTDLYATAVCLWRR